jgi:hypothetical protein
MVEELQAVVNRLGTYRASYNIVNLRDFYPYLTAVTLGVLSKSDIVHNFETLFTLCNILPHSLPLSLCGDRIDLIIQRLNLIFSNNFSVCDLRLNNRVLINQWEHYFSFHLHLFKSQASTTISMIEIPTLREARLNEWLGIHGLVMHFRLSCNDDFVVAIVLALLIFILGFLIDNLV